MKTNKTQNNNIQEIGNVSLVTLGNSSGKYLETNIPMITFSNWKTTR